MPIRVNEMTLEVTGNVVKTTDTETGNSLLRMTEDQGQEILGDLVKYFRSRNDGPNTSDESAKQSLFGHTGEPPTPVHVLKQVQSGTPHAVPTE